MDASLLKHFLSVLFRFFMFSLEKALPLFAFSFPPRKGPPHG